MRLTLRTLLAYLDGTLQPQDAEELDRLLSRNEYAKDLVTRLTAAARNPHLRVYLAHADDTSPDVNYVAAYLDNSLDSDKLVELEVAALKSDRTLAEVSSCHNILATVVRESTEVPPELLAQAYALGADGEAPHLGGWWPFRRFFDRSTSSRALRREVALPTTTAAMGGITPPVGSRARGTSQTSAAPVIDPADERVSAPAGAVMPAAATRRVFISHSSKDRDFVERQLIEVLRSAGVQPWYSRDDIRTGMQWERSILEALKGCDWFLLVMSRNSAHSEWVRDEVHWAINHRFGTIIPVVIEDCDPYDFHIRLDRIQAINVAADAQEAYERIAAMLSEADRDV